jgi:DNA-directed RNA polymerase subunit alpha
MVRESDLNAPIERLNLTVKPYNCLKRFGLTRISDVLERDEEELLALPGFGRWQYQELRNNSSVWASLAAKQSAARN